ncbi:DUF3310 domain-containing protein [Levilactobacillus enshiensis]|uniref:DUF3310 domain-containing protein n=1 Tax=Levilactobacillus enshiensis TaxID=2590213 RepID=UPI00131E7B1F|nr:DUF3310 domain-containing protein [Levilactobacillus enshiensis]
MMETAYHADTEDALNALMEKLYRNGYVWKGGAEPSISTDNVIYADEETHYLTIGSLDHYEMVADGDDGVTKLINVNLVDGVLKTVDIDGEDSPDIRPDYYKQNGKDLFDHFTEIMPTQGFRGFMIGNIFKYVTRYPAKNGVEDLRKARTYLDRLIEFEETKSDDGDDF